jgi:hypothetical protein
VTADRERLERAIAAQEALRDVSGFTAMSGRMDAELVAGMMNAIWARLDLVVAQHGVGGLTSTSAISAAPPPARPQR